MPTARGSPGNLSQLDESPLKPDCSLFERHHRKPARAAAAWPKSGLPAYFLEKMTDAR
jgi:hypothetical protein